MPPDHPFDDRLVATREGRADPARVKAVGRYAHELSDLVHSVPGLSERVQADLCSGLGTVSKEAAQQPSADEPFSDVEARFKYFARRRCAR
jgi:hypothetical protein